MSNTGGTNNFERILEVSEDAAENIKQFLKRKDLPSAGLRISAERNECGCVNYQLKIEDSPKNGDRVMEDQGLKIFIDKASIKLLRGAKMSFTKTPEDEGFTFTNPNDEHTD
ncbi:MAG: iron-sulfur cluster assembly accessory protein [Nitrososphaerales archaeon]